MIDLIVQVFRSPEIKTTTHLAVMLAIARRCGDENGVCFAKQATLGADARIHTKSVGRSVAELEKLGLIRRVKGSTDGNGRRSTDHLYLTLKPVTLPATGGSDSVNAPFPPGSPPLPGEGAHDSLPGNPGLPCKETLEETPEEEGGASRLSEDSGPVDYALAVEMIWRSASDQGRARSSKPDLEDALRSAIKRRPKGVTEEGHLRRILLGIRAYLQTPDARKEEGSFQRGIHRIVTRDRWASFLDGDTPIPADRLPVDPQIGTDAEPGPDLQRLWAELAAQGMPWNEERGPRPGRAGCRISADIQREFGFTPWEGEQPLDAALAEPLALPAPGSAAAPAAPDAGDDDATAFM